MFVRVKRSVRDGHAYEYLQLVRSYRDDGRVRQQVLATLGRRDVLVASGQLDGLLVSLARFSEMYDERGFARVRCDECRREFRVALSCKTRGFCPRPRTLRRSVLEVLAVPACGGLAASRRGPCHAKRAVL